MEKDYGHQPVLLEECMEALCLRPGGIYLDGTLGRGGHTLEILRRAEGSRVICLDRDQTAITEAGERLAAYSRRVTLIHREFAQLGEVLRELGDPPIDGMLFDLGVSSPQLDDASRGFSYRLNAPLDMRMDEDTELTAHQIVNTWPQEELRRILYEYGEERYAPQIARSIVRRREVEPIETTWELVDVIRTAMPPAALREKQHPAKRTFQAIRIAVNGELDQLEPMLRAAADGLKPGGRLAVITFHSLEDRIVKQTLRDLATGCTCPPEFPVCVCGKKPKMDLVARRPITPGQAELETNPRARSAKLRVAERTEWA
jgi:16S rRNA (cytosine1402-N4)-methyltransferase